MMDRNKKIDPPKRYPSSKYSVIQNLGEWSFEHTFYHDDVNGVIEHLEHLEFTDRCKERRNMVYHVCDLSNNVIYDHATFLLKLKMGF